MQSEHFKSGTIVTRHNLMQMCIWGWVSPRSQQTWAVTFTSTAEEAIQSHCCEASFSPSQVLHAGSSGRRCLNQKDWRQNLNTHTFVRPQTQNCRLTDSCISRNTSSTFTRPLMRFALPRWLREEKSTINWSSMVWVIFICFKLLKFIRTSQCLRKIFIDSPLYKYYELNRFQFRKWNAF